MVLVQRKNQTPPHQKGESGGDGFMNDQNQQQEVESSTSTMKQNSFTTNKSKKSTWCSGILSRIIASSILIVPLYFLYIQNQRGLGSSGGNFGITLHLKRGSDGQPVLGPHSITIDTPHDGIVYARITGDALVHISLTEDQPHHWAGTFDLPIRGKYKLETFMMEGGNEVGLDDGNKVQEESNFEVFGTPLVYTKKPYNVFVDGAWIHSSKVKYSIQENPNDGTTKPSVGDYIWVDPTKVLEGTEMNGLDVDGTLIVMDGVVPDGDYFFDFKDLSNYELVCWVGSHSAEQIHEKFLTLRRSLFNYQRRFKFHYYPATSFTEPDQDWTEENKQKFRKCKHVLISLDEPVENYSQLEYKIGVTNFLKHMATAISDDTFPIWVFTMMSSTNTNNNCHDPYLKRSSNHPCNDALKDMFETTTFPDRVQLLDNTDLSAPKVSSSNNQDVIANIALRIFVLVGKKVSEWREKGQIGHINGLRRGDVEEPNFELIAYADWSKPI